MELCIDDTQGMAGSMKGRGKARVSEPSLRAEVQEFASQIGLASSSSFQYNDFNPALASKSDTGNALSPFSHDCEANQL